MDEKTELLICLGAATAANCVPCFDYYFKKASAAGITAEEVRKGVELACKIKDWRRHRYEEQHQGYNRPGLGFRAGRQREVRSSLLQMIVQDAKQWNSSKSTTSTTTG